jgi:2-hydroxymuconate-semialdehyde hydrolase
MLNKLAGRFRTIVYDYPGEHHDDGAHLKRITHANLVDDVFGLIHHLNLGRVFLFGLSFGSTVTLGVLHREPRRFPKAVIQGAFSHRPMSFPERIALRFGRLMPGTLSNLPLREQILAWNSQTEFPTVVADRWGYYLEQNGLTPIAAIAHRCSLLAKLDLRPILSSVPNEILLLHGREDRIVPRTYFDELSAGLKNARPLLVPLMGHQPHFTQAEMLASTVSEFLLPCAPTGCPKEESTASAMAASSSKSSGPD